jgi:hypothetical protein
MNTFMLDKKYNKNFSHFFSFKNHSEKMYQSATSLLPPKTALHLSYIQIHQHANMTRVLRQTCWRLSGHLANTFFQNYPQIQ